jgi:hypothetical protein
VTLVLFGSGGARLALSGGLVVAPRGADAVTIMSWLAGVFDWTSWDGGVMYRAAWDRVPFLALTWGAGCGAPRSCYLALA